MFAEWTSVDRLGRQTEAERKCPSRCESIRRAEKDQGGNCSKQKSLIFSFSSKNSHFFLPALLSAYSFWCGGEYEEVSSTVSLPKSLKIWSVKPARDARASATRTVDSERKSPVTTEIRPPGVARAWGGERWVGPIPGQPDALSWVSLKSGVRRGHVRLDWLWRLPRVNRLCTLLVSLSPRLKP